MPFHLLDFLGLDHHHHCHDAVNLHHQNDIHSSHHDDGHLNHHDATTFLSTPSGRPLRSVLGDDLAIHAGSSSAAKVTAHQAADFLDSGLLGVTRSHASASSFLSDATSFLDDGPTSFISVQKSLTDLVQNAPPAALVPLHALSIIGALPGHIAFELGEGFLFGWSKGFVLALTGKTIGSAVAFGIGRSASTCGCLKDRITHHMNRWPLCQKVCNGVEKGGATSIFVIRMAPVPCVVKNYAPALFTEIPFSTYLFASLAGLIPTTAAHVYAGTLAPSAVALARGATSMSGVQAAALASPVVAGVLLTTYAGYYLHKHIIEDDSEGKENEDEAADSIESVDEFVKSKAV